MTVLVTGGCGFIGSNLLTRWVTARPDWMFVNLDSMSYAANPASVGEIEGAANYRFVQCDLRDRPGTARVVDDVRPGAIVHLAAESHVDRSISDPGIFVDTNVVGTFNLLEAARMTGVERFLHVSTDEVYGSLGDGEWTTEESVYRPSSPYSASKAGSDHLVRSYGRTFGMGVNVTHCSNNFGPRQYPEKLIPLFLAKMVRGESLPVYGEGLNRRDWLYVDDHADALWAVLTQGRAGETYDIGADHEVSNIEMVRMLCELVAEETGRSAEEFLGLITHVADRPGHDWRYAIDSRKIREELGWAPQVTFAEGLRRTVRWYLENPDWVAAGLARARSGR